MFQNLVDSKKVAPNVGRQQASSLSHKKEVKLLTQVIFSKSFSLLLIS